MKTKMVMHADGKDGAATWLHQSVEDEDVYVVVHRVNGNEDFQQVTLRASEELLNGFDDDSWKSRVALLVVGIARIEENC